MDMISSAVIIVIAVGIALYYTTSLQEEENLYDLSIEIMEKYTTSSINTFNNVEIRQFFLDNKISNIDNSLAQQTAEFYVRGDPGDAEELTEVFIETFERRNFYINISLENQTNQYTPYISDNAIDFEKAETSYVSTRKILLIQNSKVYTFDVEVRIWQ